MTRGGPEGRGGGEGRRVKRLTSGTPWRRYCVPQIRQSSDNKRLNVALMMNFEDYGIEDWKGRH